MRFILLLAPVLLLAGCAIQPDNRTSSAPLSVAQVDIDRYLGLWHEQARLPNWFERDCVYVTAEYGLREDGDVSVRNFCRESDGHERVANGHARTVGAEGEGKLEVSFFGPFWGDYWVIERADDYSWSIVSEPKGRYLWILTRAETISADQRADFERRLVNLGYDTSQLVWKT